MNDLSQSDDKSLLLHSASSYSSKHGDHDESNNFSRCVRGPMPRCESCCTIITHSKSRWHTFACVLLAASCAGTSYAFGIFSQVLRSKLSLSQADLSIISSCGSSGLYTQVITGLIMERFGPHTVLYIGTCLIFAGNMWIWLAVQKQLPHSVPVLSVIWFFSQVRHCSGEMCMYLIL